MKSLFAHQITKTIFAYELIGFDKFISYDRNDRTILLNDAETGAPLKIKEKDEDLDFETFILVAQNMYMDMVEIDHCVNLESNSFFSKS